MIIDLGVIGFSLLGIKSILINRNGIENSFNWIILAFVLGYRTFEPFPGLKLHPIEIFIYACIIRIALSGSRKYRRMSLSVFVISIFFITYFLMDLLTRYNPMVLLEFKNAFLLTLVFLITQYIHFHKAYLIQLMKYYLIAASIISILGILEFLFPSFMSSIFGSPIKSDYTSSNIFFNRLAFLFWGSHLAANLIPPVFPILLLLKAENVPITNNNYFLTLLIFINLFSIYLSGNRISWLILTILLLATILHYRNSLIPHIKSYVIMVTLLFVAYIYSQPVEGRYISTFKALSGNIDVRYDSSSGARMQRAKIALESITNYPQGTGWGSQGWVHSDVLQIAASIGIIPGIILFIGPLILLFRMYRSYLLAHSNEKTAFFVCCGFLIYIIISFSLNGNILKVQSGTPLFVLWALTDAYLVSDIQTGIDRPSIK